MDPNQSVETPVQPSVQNPVELSSSSKNFWKYIGVGMAIVSILTAIGMVGFVLSQKSKPSAPEVKNHQPILTNTPSPTPDPTANWQTYQGQTFSFKYPSDLKFKENNPSAHDIGADFPNPKNYEFPDGILIDVRALPSNMSIQDAIKNGQAGGSQYDPTGITFSNVEVGGITAIATDKGPSAIGAYNVYVKKDSMLYTFSLLSHTVDDINGYQRKTFETLLSSIKFTGQISPTPRLAGSGEGCGGNVYNPPQCQRGYRCAARPGQNIPLGDVGGICVLSGN